MTKWALGMSKRECIKDHVWIQISPYKFQCDNCEKIESKTDELS